ncbi:MAG TPA: c-type cytochrome [Candidatus Deferrimicrobiaceae bacterium]|nr:c-type cytochrome [Candidatus Deferrimicrobiaceae bacterium]
MRLTPPRIALASALLVAALAGAPAEAAGPLDERGALKSVTCAACHGQAGNSRSSAMPIIAGLDTAYFKKQIEAYAAGKRLSPEMEPYAKQVLNLGVDDVAAYFASRKREPTPVPSPADAVARGRNAAAQCVICHGPQGLGDPAKLIPSLAGQAPGYLREQMLLFKQDRRSPGDPALAALKALLKSIPDETLADLAIYYSSLR